MDDSQQFEIGKFSQTIGRVIVAIHRALCPQLCGQQAGARLKRWMAGDGGTLPNQSGVNSKYRVG